jgi:hypothetical protein
MLLLASLLIRDYKHRNSKKELAMFFEICKIKIFFVSLHHELWA